VVAKIELATKGQKGSDVVKMPLRWATHDGKKYAAVQIQGGYLDGRFYFEALMTEDVELGIGIELVLTDANFHKIDSRSAFLNTLDPGDATVGTTLEEAKIQPGTHFLLVRDSVGHGANFDLELTAAEPLPQGLPFGEGDCSGGCGMP
jgi:hypothetical protein